MSSFREVLRDSVGMTIVTIITVKSIQSLHLLSALSFLCAYVWRSRIPPWQL